MTALPLPAFIIGGAPRSGTTWLWHALDRHPDVAMARPVRPEPKFFLRDDLFARGLEFYSQQWFQPLSRQCVAGEKSTNYLESAESARRIHGCLPDVKLIFILRDPVQRAWSNYLWSRSANLEPLPFLDALEAEESREAELQGTLRYARPHAYFSRGCYARLLTPWFAALGPERVLCLRFEDIERDHGGLLARVHDYLGVPARPHDADGLGRINPAPASDDTLTLDERARAWLETRYAAPNEALGQLLGPAFDVWQYEPR